MQVKENGYIMKLLKSHVSLQSVAILKEIKIYATEIIRQAIMLKIKSKRSSSIS